MAVASDHHAARPAFQSVSEPNADSGRVATVLIAKRVACRSACSARPAPVTARARGWCGMRAVTSLVDTQRCHGSRRSPAPRSCSCSAAAPLTVCGLAGVARTEPGRPSRPSAESSAGSPARLTQAERPLGQVGDRSIARSGHVRPACSLPGCASSGCLSGAVVGAGVAAFIGAVRGERDDQVDRRRGGRAGRLVYGLEEAAAGGECSLCLDLVRRGPGAAGAERAGNHALAGDREAAVGVYHCLVGFGEGRVEGARCEPADP